MIKCELVYCDNYKGKRWKISAYFLKENGKKMYQEAIYFVSKPTRKQFTQTKVDLVKRVKFSKCWDEI